MIIQACLNGARPEGYHPKLPLRSDEIARQAAHCVRAGAAELHIHPRDADGRESLSAVDETVLAVRSACPGTLVGVSTGAWIEKSGIETIRRIKTWREQPDYASVNLSESDAPAIIDLLHRKGIGVEAGLASVADVETFLRHSDYRRIFRVLIEIEQQDLNAGFCIVKEVENLLSAAGIRRPILLHGSDATVWPLVNLAFSKRWSTRIGLEDGKRLPDGSITPDNAALVAAAVRALREC